MQNELWKAPILVGLSSAIGLVTALVADGLADITSVFLLLVPVYISIRYGLLSGIKTPVKERLSSK